MPMQSRTAESSGRPLASLEGQTVEALTSAQRQSCRILVVDDDEAILSTVAEILLLEGYTVRTAGNGEEALVQIQQESPMLVLLDMRMPVLDGWGFARELRERGLELPILVMTAAQDANRWANEISALGFLAKPFDIVTLIDLVDYWCARLGAA
jgi:two-component system, chemotaxis family, chemotaxis protein CheY